MAIMAYSYAYDITRKDFYRDTVYEIYKFLKQEMFSGGFYTAVDADSENEEGKFYTWDYDEIKNSTEKDFSYDFDILPDGNFYDNYSRKSGRNILFMKGDLTGNPASMHRKELEKLKKIRDARKKPMVDDKILADTNGLVIKALSIASMVFQDRDILNIAENSADFVMNKMYRDRKLMHSFRNNDAKIDGMFDDYSYTVSGLLSLYEASQNEIYLNYARDLQDKLIKTFYDSDNGGFYSAGDELPVRLKETYDNAIPSGFSFEIGNLIVFNYLDSNFQDVLDRSINSVAPDMARQPMFFSYTISYLFNLIEFYKIETGSKDVLDYLGRHYPYNYYFLKSKSNGISVCDTNKCFIIKDLSGLKSLIKC